ncbi:MAG: hypothetical protein H0X45_00380 [Planctomycetes bacterium]|nr:hypothetical protein [Planctomycetota bacterium]
MPKRRQHPRSDHERQALALALLHLADVLNLATSLPWRDPYRLLSAAVHDLTQLAPLSKAIETAIQVLDVQRHSHGADPRATERRLARRRRTLRSIARWLRQRGESRK